MTSLTQESTVEIKDDVLASLGNASAVKIRKAPYRYLADGTYDNKPLSPSYFKDYYRKTRKPHECPYCHAILSHREGLCKHNMKAKKCLKLHETLAQKESYTASRGEAVDELATPREAVGDV